MKKTFLSILVGAGIGVILALYALSITSCNQHKQHQDKQEVKTYREKHTTNGNDDYLYWYVMFNDNTNKYYYYSSPTPLDNYSNINWSSTTTNPASSSFEETQSLSIDNTELPTEIQTEFSESQGFESAEQSTSTESEGFDSDNSSESSESSGFDSGDSGSDGGGGDGGGE